MIVAVGSDKGSPGATTLAVLLGVCWPGERLVCELDPAGADLPYRLAGVEGRPLAASPSIATLAVESRPGSPPRPLELFAQPTALGIPVIAGETSPVRFARLTPQLPAIAVLAATWPGTLIADLGRLAPTSPALPVARAASLLVLVTAADVAGLGHLRDRVEDLAASLAPDTGGTPGPTLAVAVRAARGDGRAAAGRVGTLLASIGSPVPVLGVLADDPRAAAALWAGPPSRRLARSRLVGSARAITDRLHASSPELAASPDVETAAASTADTAPATLWAADGTRPAPTAATAIAAPAPAVAQSERSVR